MSQKWSADLSGKDTDWVDFLSENKDLVKDVVEPSTLVLSSLLFKRKLRKLGFSKKEIYVISTFYFVLLRLALETAKHNRRHI